MHPNYSRLNLSNDISTLNPPIAESTVLEDRQNSLRSPRGIFKRRTISPISNASKQLSRTNLNSPVARIDPHVITDAESNGLVSRIVKYYEHSQNEIEKNKSVYNKFGQFPIVHLKKNEIKYSPKNNMIRSSSVRIAPPEKAIFNKSYRNAILRSNSMMHLTNPASKLVPTLMKKDEANKIISNEPLSPIVGEEHHYPIQSKSVLDALKEISRKRINNEEINLDRSKKYCYNNDIPDSPNISEPGNAKRPREQTSPTKITQKKMKIKNNDIMSSLSSSMFVNRRPQQPVDQVSVQVSAQPQPARKEVELLQKTMSAPLPIKNQSIPPIPVQPKQKKLTLFNKRVDSSAQEAVRHLEEEEEEDDAGKIQFIKPKTRPTGLERKTSMNSVEKSKLSLMLSCLSGDLDEPDFPVKKVVEQPVEPVKIVEKPAASISFATTTTTTNVTPIAAPAQTTATKSSVEQTSGGFQLAVSSKPVDSTDGKKNIEQSAKSEPPKFSFGTSSEAAKIPENPAPTISISSSGFTIPVPAKQEEAKKPETPIVLTKPVETIENPAPVISFTSTSTPPSVSAGLSFLGSQMNSSASASADPNKSLISFGTPAKSTAEVKTTNANGGFSFGVASTSAPKTAPVSTVTSTSVGSTMTFGGFTGGFGGAGGILGGIPATQSSVAPKITPVTGIMAFGSQNPVTTAPAAPAITSGFFSAPSVTTNVTQATSTPSFGFSSQATASGSGGSTFSFGSNTTPAPVSASTAVSAPAPVPAPSFNFGGAPATTQSQTQSQNTFSFGSNSNATVKPAFSFGEPAKTESSTFGSFSKPTETTGSGFGNSTAPASGTGLFGQPTTAPVFPGTQGSSTNSMFGGNNNQNQAASTTQASFNFQQPSNTTNPAPSNFSFPSPTTTASGVGFSFPNSAATQATTSAPVSGFSFQAAATTTSAFNFGTSSAPAATTAPSAFGFSQAKPTESVKPFGFGGTTASAPAPAQNFFGSAQNQSTFTFKAPTGNQTPQNGGTFGAGSNASDVSVAFNLKLPAQSNSAGIFGQPSQNAGSTGIFGQASQNNQSQGAPPAYSFGGSADQGQNKPFAFGGTDSQQAQPSQNQNQANVFGSNTVSASFNFSAGTNPTGAPQAFNFQAPGNPNANNMFAAQPQLGNVFNIGTGGNTAQRRPVRTATRRLK